MELTEAQKEKIKRLEQLVANFSVYLEGVAKTMETTTAILSGEAHKKDPTAVPRMIEAIKENNAKNKNRTTG